ncbi:MAG: acetyl-CoA carboxylase carboxyl transferase subunit alpha, partial [Candidatus Marinimicrobia bacterium]|nr:acetyl-CoA carboxylase carboxyl transferase subunit alpha [Candidatus Neomarinimicrobiota bacterium]
KDNLYRNFGMPYPEGYRKALRHMKLAEKYGLPVVTLVDTIGAYPGLEAEERGQAEAIARNLFEMSHLSVPIIVIVIGEGASGGALGIGVGDRLIMLENTWYSVISPEGCATILYRDATQKKKAAEAMRVTASDLLEMGIADRIVEEPLGGAHHDYKAMAKILKDVILEELGNMSKLSVTEMIEKRIKKIVNMGSWEG